MLVFRATSKKLSRNSTYSVHHSNDHWWSQRVKLPDSSDNPHEYYMDVSVTLWAVTRLTNYSWPKIYVVLWCNHVYNNLCYCTVYSIICAQEFVVFCFVVDMVPTLANLYVIFTHKIVSDYIISNGNISVTLLHWDIVMVASVSVK